MGVWITSDTATAFTHRHLTVRDGYSRYRRFNNPLTTMAVGLHKIKKYFCGTAVLTSLVLLIMTKTRITILRHLPDKPETINSNKTIVNTSTSHGVGLQMTSEYAVHYMPEDVAMTYSACSDDKMAAHIKKSRISIHGNTKGEYHIGDAIYILIKLYNGYGQPLARGGAILRARMFNIAKKAFATSTMTDHGDGSYTAKFEASWTGNSTIKVQISYTPETIRAIYYMRRKLRSTREIEGIFSVGQYREVKLCHPTWEALRDYNYSNICNLTGDNSGMPWYCGKPNNVHLLCEDWTEVRDKTPFPDLPLTPCEVILMGRAGKDIEQTLHIHIKGEKSHNSSTIPIPNIPCRDFDVASLWTRTQPTGFMYGNKWQLRHCKGPEDKELLSCLKDWKLLLFGDSTVRFWYKYIVEKWKCVPRTEQWTKERWHKRASCGNEKHNFTVHWLPHSQPFFENGLNRYSRTSISRHLDETGNEEHVIALVHVYLHTVWYHHSVFIRKIRKIRASVENLLNRNRFTKVFIKGPHTYTNVPKGTARLSDYQSLIYRQILNDEFAGLYDKVVFLDNSDITNAMAISDNHPPETVAIAMVKQMLAYMC